MLDGFCLLALYILFDHDWLCHGFTLRNLLLFHFYAKVSFKFTEMIERHTFVSWHNCWCFNLDRLTLLILIHRGF